MSFVSLLSFIGSSMPAKSLQSCPTLCDPRDYSPLGSSVHGDSLSKNTGVGLPCPPPGVLPDPGLNPCLLCLLHWQVGSLSLAPPGKPLTGSCPYNSLSPENPSELYIFKIIYLCIVFGCAGSSLLRTSFSL